MGKPTKGNFKLVLRQTNALSGTPKILRRQADLLTSLGHQVEVISDNFHHDLIKNPLVKCRKTFKWPKNNLTQRKVFDLQARYQAKKTPGIVIGNGDTLHQDILCMHTCVHKGAEVGLDVSKNTSIPFHRDIFTKGSFKTLICNSQMMRDDLIKRFNITTPIHVLYPGFDPAILKTNEEKVKSLRDQLSPHKELIIGVITSGNLSNRGAYALLEGLKFLSDEEKNKVSILIVGKEGRPQKIYDLAESVGMKDRVHWIEPRPDVGNIISSVDVIVHAAKMEAFGMSVLEAMAFGKPLITTQYVGCNELFGDEQREFIIEKQDAELIASKLKIFINNYEFAFRIGKLNQEIARNYTWNHYDQGFLEILRAGDYL